MSACWMINPVVKTISICGFMSTMLATKQPTEIRGFITGSRIEPAMKMVRYKTPRPSLSLSLVFFISDFHLSFIIIVGEFFHQFAYRGFQCSKDIHHSPILRLVTISPLNF
jgi:hypothetical protein